MTYLPLCKGMFFFSLKVVRFNKRVLQMEKGIVSEKR